MRFDKADQKIIECVYHNWRITISDIARKTRLSRRQVDYRLKEFQTSGVIRSFFLALDYPKLGFQIVTYAFVRVNRQSNILLIGKAFSDSKRCTSWGRAWSKYDIFSNWVFQSTAEQKKFFSGLKSRFRSEILELTLVEAVHAEFFPLRVINDSCKESYSLNRSRSSQESLDRIDKDILKHLSSNSRMPIISLAKEVGISPESCVYRLKRLRAKQIILGSRVQFDLSKAGYFATCLFIDRKKPKSILTKLQSACSKLPSINYLIVSKKSPNAIIQVFHKDESTLRAVIKELRSLLANDLESLQVVQLEDDISIVDPVPFLS